MSDMGFYVFTAQIYTFVYFFTNVWGNILEAALMQLLTFTNSLTLLSLCLTFFLDKKSNRSGGRKKIKKF